MSARSKTNSHNYWGTVASPSQLPNVSGATIQDSDLEVGDTCFSISDSISYTCTDKTVGAAIWSSTGTDSNAIHKNVAAEISTITEKASPVSADLIIIEDSENSNNKKKVQVGNLPGGSGGGAGDVVGALNTNSTMGVSAIEEIIGQFTYDGSAGSTHTFKAIIEPDAAATSEIRLYDRGPVAGPPVSAEMVAKLTTSSAGLQVLSETLTATASPTFPDNNEIYNTDRMYEVRAYINGTEGDNLYIGKVSLNVAS